MRHERGFLQEILRRYAIHSVDRQSSRVSQCVLNNKSTARVSRSAEKSGKWQETCTSRVGKQTMKFNRLFRDRVSQ